MGYYTPKRSHLKIAVLPQCEAFSADFAGRRSICALRRAKITEGERVVPPVVALHGKFLCTNLGRRSISKGNMATPQLKPCLWLKLWGGHVCLSNTCHGLSCEVAMFACQKLPLPGFTLCSGHVSFWITAPASVCQVPQLSGFKLWGGHVCLQYLSQVEMCGCLLLKCCACHGFKLWCGHVCFWNIVPATGLLAAKVLRLLRA